MTVGGGSRSRWRLTAARLSLPGFSTTQEPYDTDKMAAAFSAQFAKQAFTVGQLLVFAFENKKMLGLVVKSMQGECSVSAG